MHVDLVERLLYAHACLSNRPMIEKHLEFLNFALSIFAEVNKETTKYYFGMLRTNRIFGPYWNGKTWNRKYFDIKEAKIFRLDFRDQQIHLPLQEIYVGASNVIRRKQEIEELQEKKLKNLYTTCKGYLYMSMLRKRY